MIYQQQDADDRINSILMIGNELIGQQGKCLARMGAQKSGNRNFLFFIREQGNGISIIF